MRILKHELLVVVLVFLGTMESVRLGTVGLVSVVAAMVLLILVLVVLVEVLYQIP